MTSDVHDPHPLCHIEALLGRPICSYENASTPFRNACRDCGMKLLILSILPECTPFRHKFVICEEQTIVRWRRDLSVFGSGEATTVYNMSVSVLPLPGSCIFHGSMAEVLRDAVISMGMC
jgi:hypothetical protein